MSGSGIFSNFREPGENRPAGIPNFGQPSAEQATGVFGGFSAYSGRHPAKKRRDICGHARAHYRAVSLIGFSLFGKAPPVVKVCLAIGWLSLGAGVGSPSENLP